MSGGLADLIALPVYGGVLHVLSNAQCMDNDRYIMQPMDTGAHIVLQSQYGKHQYVGPTK